MDHESRLRVLDEFIAGYETEFGEITEEEMQGAAAPARARTVTTSAVRK